MPCKLQHAVCHVCLQLQHFGFQDVASDVKHGHLSLLEDLLIYLLLCLRFTLKDKVALASKVIFDSTSITMSISDRLPCGLLISKELVGVDLITETRFDDELLCSSVIPREASMLMPSRVISPLVLILISGSESLSAILSSNFVVVCHILIYLNLDCIK